MISYQVELYSSVIDEMKELYEAHWEEVANDKETIKLNPDYTTYFTLEKAGVLHVVSVRDDDKLVGYHMSLIHPHMHYKESLTAFTDIFFIQKDYRKGRVGINLFKFMENSLRAKGVQKIYMGTKLKLDIGPVLDKLGYTAVERIYTKLLRTT